MSKAIEVLATNGFYVAANIHIYDDSRFFGLNCFDKISKDDFCSCFVKNFEISEGVDIELERL